MWLARPTAIEMASKELLEKKAQLKHVVVKVTSKSGKQVRFLGIKCDREEFLFFAGRSI